VSFSGVRIALIDTGVRGTHEDLAGKQVDGWDFIADGPYPAGANRSACAGHGTRTASLAGGGTNNQKGIAAAGFNSVVRQIKAWTGTTEANCTFFSAFLPDRAVPIRWAYQTGAHIINMSYSGNVQSPDEALALQEAFNSGVLPVASAGNTGIQEARYPCANNFTLCVGASDNAGNRYVNATYGPWVDVAAPGIGIWFAHDASDNSYNFSNGASLAVPHVSGTAALLRSIGCLASAQIDRFAATSRPNGWTAWGFIDAGAALWYAPC
jgi:subtilisin family serine protease